MSDTLSLNINQESSVKQNTSRMSNFELLRIICMILIVAHHFSVHSSFASDISIANLYLVRFLSIGGKIGVNVYVLISGYFMINSKFKLKKLLNLIFETFFYSIIIYSIFCIFGVQQFNIFDFLRYCFPISAKQYWFMTFYILIYILSPFLNKCLKNCSQKEAILLICILVISQITLPGVPSLISNELLWFITLYTVAAFVRIYPIKMTNSNKIMLPIFLVSFLIIALTKIFANLSWDTLTHIMCLICSVSMFCVFKNLKIKNNKFVNVIASTTLGVYLIHDNNILRPHLWNSWLNTPKHAYFESFYLYSIISILLVFMVCSLIDFLRKLIFGLCFKLKSKKTKSI